MLSNKLKNQLEKLGEKFKLDFLILFGSRANGTFNKNSDWDFAYFRKENLSRKEKQDLTIGIIEILNDDNIDLVEIDLLKSPSILIYNIIKEGILLYSRNKNYFNLIEENIFFDYIDSINMLKEFKQDFLKS